MDYVGGLKCYWLCSRFSLNCEGLRIEGIKRVLFFIMVEVFYYRFKMSCVIVSVFFFFNFWVINCRLIGWLCMILGLFRLNLF